MFDLITLLVSVSKNVKLVLHFFSLNLILIF